MTNEEITLEALKLCKKTRIFIPANEYLDTAINSLEENTKLKTEIEQLKERLEIKDNNFELYSNALEEIEQLKSELEQWKSANLKLSTELIRAECEKHQLEVYKKKAQYALSCSVNAKLMDSSEISE